MPDTVARFQEEYRAYTDLQTHATTPADTSTLLTNLRSFCFPGGEEAARRIRTVRTTQSGEMRMSPEARWIRFTADETTHTTRSGFRWEAHLDPGKIGSPTVIDAYEQGHGRLVVKLGRIVPVRRIAGNRGRQRRDPALPRVDRFLPAAAAESSDAGGNAVGPSTLRFHDRLDPTGATVDLDLSDEGCPLACHATRPRLVGKQTVLTRGPEWEANSASTKASAWRPSWKSRGICPKVHSPTSEVN